MIIKMGKIYQPSVIEKADELIEILIEERFFEDYEIENYDFATNYLRDKLTDKFILGTLESEDDDVFTEEEYELILRELVAGSVLYELKEKGLVDSYEDEDTEEMFFLTKEGKKLLEKKGDFK
jgi:hypothetical protein